jgi:F0F1-type ATP synthase assembly protein I
MEPDQGDDDDVGGGDAAGPQSANWGLAFDLGLRLGISVVLGVGGGLLTDSWLHTSPIFTLIGMVLGIGAAMYTIWDVARQSMRR